MKEFLTCLMAATGFSWPLVLRFAPGLSAAWTMITVMIGTVIVGTIYFILQGRGIPATSALAAGVAAGVMNGFGFIAYSALFSLRDADVSKIVAITAGLIPVMTALGTLLIFHEVPSLQKVSGILIIGLGIYLVR